MYFCYLDEAGDTARCSQQLPDQSPVFVLVGVIVPRETQRKVLWEFLQLKKQFEPSLANQLLSDVVRYELKGSSIRRDLRASSRRRTRRAMGLIDKTLRILEQGQCQIIGKVVVKEEGRSTPDEKVYPPAILELATSFEQLLARDDSPGLLILDSRTKTKNEGNVHVVTTQRFRTGGDPFPHLVEAPVFGHSDTHVLIQLADIIASAVVFPIACVEYAHEYTWNTHVTPQYHVIKTTFGTRLQQLEYRYTVGDQKRGGFQVVDPVHRRPTHHLFR